MDKQEFDQWDEERRQRRKEREARRAERRHTRAGERPFNPGEPRKDKVLHTRISEDLDDSLRKAAEDLRVPVSNLVRNVLEDVFDVVETVTENVEDLVEDLMGESHKARERVGRRRRTREAFSDRAARGPDPVDVEDPVAEVIDTDRPEFAEVVGWQPLVLNAAQQCADCGRDLRKGDRAFLGLGPADGTQLYLCRECLDAR